MISEASLLPAEAVDAHMHIYAEGVHKGDAPFTVPRATVDDYQHVMRKLGIESVVLVQSMLYGTDNSVMLSGLRTLGNSARGIAVVNVKASEALLDDRDLKGLSACVPSCFTVAFTSGVTSLILGKARSAAGKCIYNSMVENCHSVWM